jgi:ATP-dependent RNA helicase RhlE
MCLYNASLTHSLVAFAVAVIGYRAAEFHSQLTQSMREQTLVNFKSGKMPTLLATDVAARGIHINNIQYVINYDFPGSLDQVNHV